MDKEISASFIKANSLLVEEINQAIVEAKREPYSESTEAWKNPNIWHEIIEDLETLVKNYKNDIVMLAKFQVGLSKYFDYFYIGWATQNNQKIIQSRVTEIVNVAAQIIKPYLQVSSQPLQRCGSPHEDGACVIGNLGPRYDGLDLPHSDDTYGRWPTLPADEAKNFQCLLFCSYY